MLRLPWLYWLSIWSARAGQRDSHWSVQRGVALFGRRRAAKRMCRSWELLYALFALGYTLGGVWLG
ncbi:MAG: hypothetical protein R2867_10375 [Caldilineaceae bacterium]